MNQSLAGYWVHSKTGNDQLRGWSAKETGDFFAHFERIQPTASLFHETLEWAVEAKKRVPACNVVYRRYIDPKRGITEGNIWRSWNAQQHIDEFLPWWRPGLILNIWNEANPDLGEMDKFSKVASDVMDAFGKEGKSIVIWQPSVGTPNEGYETIDRLTPLWDAFDRWYDLHIMGWHEYGTHRGMLFNEKGSDYNVYPYRVGRATELIHPKVVARGHKGFRIIFTEFGSDYAFDGQGGKRGYRDYWGGKKFGQEVVGAIEKTKKPYVLGYCLYKKGNSSGWGDFDTLNDTDYDKEIEEGTKNGRLAPVPYPVEPPMPTPTPLPYVPIPAVLTGMVELTVDNAAYPLQARPTNDAKEKVGKLAIGERVKLYRSTDTRADGLIWHFCQRDSTPLGESVVGWCSYPMPLPDPIILPPPVDTTDEIAAIAAIVQKLHGIALLTESVANDLHKLAVEMAAKKAA